MYFHIHNIPSSSCFRSAFFFFCNEERGSVKVAFPSYGVADIAKELGKRWEKCTDRPRFGAMAEKDKGRYERVSLKINVLPFSL